MSEDPQKPTVGGRALRKLPWLALAGAMAFLVARHYQRLPSALEVEYHLGAFGQDLARLTLDYRRGDESLRVIRYSFESGRAPKKLLHKVSLVDGDYRVVAELFYRQRPPRARGARADPLSPRGLRVSRPLLVRGSGRVKVLIGAEP